MMQDWKANKIENHPWVNLEFNFDLQHACVLLF